MKTEEAIPMSNGEHLVSLVTHEIKNPLTSVSGYARLAEDAVKSNDQELALQSLEIVRAEAARILRLAEDLLDASCLRAGRFTIRPSQIDLPSIIRCVAEQYSVMSRHDIEVCATSPFPLIEADGARLRQVVENLISNAVKYCGDDAPIRVAMETAGEKVRVLISNGGMRIPPEKLAMLFQPFARLDHSGNAKAARQKGTGLGLYIARQLVEAHGGSLTASSEDPVGTTFTIELPLKVAPAN